MAGNAESRPRMDGGALSRQERDVLAASARGANAVEAACELGLPVSELRAAIASAIRKLGAQSKLEPVVIALRDGVIDLETVRGAVSS